MNSLTILHTETLKKWGGQQNRLLLESLGLSERGHRVIIACHRGSILAGKAKEHGIKVYEVNMLKQAHLSTIPRLVKIIKQENVNIVVTHSSVDSWAGGLAAKLTGKKLVRFRHNIYRIGKNPLTKFIYHIPDAIVCVSDEVRRTLVQCGIRDNKLKVIHSSVDINKFNPQAVRPLPREEIGIPDGSLVIGNTSSFTAVKGQEFLLKAFNSISEQHPCYLLFASRMLPAYRERYLEFVKAGFREKVIFLGHRDDVPEVLKSIDIFVFPSLVEAFGTSLIEAMAMEKPVVVSDIPTFRDFVTNGKNGMFFRVGDREDLAQKVTSLIENEHLRRQLGINARSSVLEKFTFERMVGLTEALYRRILDAR